MSTADLSSALASGVAEARAAMSEAARMVVQQRAQIDALLGALKALRAEHSRVDPHHEDRCALCRMADAAIAKAERQS